MASLGTDAVRAGVPSGGLPNKGAGWWNGNFLNALHNYHEPPDSAVRDAAAPKILRTAAARAGGEVGRPTRSDQPGDE